MFLVIYTLTGRLPVENFIKSQTLLYFARLYTTKLNPLLKESFLLCQNLDSQGIYTWFSYAKSIIDETGLDNLLFSWPYIKI
jgi:hypothetical protein